MNDKTKFDEAVRRFEKRLPLSVAHTSCVMAISQGTIRNLIAEQKLRAVRLSNRRLAISASEVERFMEEGVTV